MCRLIEVIESEEPTGEGKELNPYRNLKRHWSKDGTLLVETDPLGIDIYRCDLIRAYYLLRESCDEQQVRRPRGRGQGTALEGTE